MPTYDFRNKDTGEVFEKFMKIADRDQYLLDNPHLEYIIGTPTVVDSVRAGVTKPSNGWKEVLQKVNGTAGSTMSKHARYL